jgi:hypothetical protein
MVSTLPTATAPPALRQHVAYRHDLGGPGPLGREANRKCFVEKLDLDDFDDFVEIDRPNHDALARLNVDQIFCIQAIECLVNGRPPDLEKAGDRAFAQCLPRLECTGDDAMLDRLIGLVLGTPPEPAPPRGSCAAA